MFRGVRVLFQTHLFARSLAAARQPAYSIKYKEFRTFTTTHVRGVENPLLSDSARQALKGTKMWETISKNPELLQELQDTLKVFQDEGFDPANPSMTVLLKSSKLREQLKKVGTILQSSGLGSAEMKEAYEVITKANAEDASKK